MCMNVWKCRYMCTMYVLRATISAETALLSCLLATCICYYHLDLSSANKWSIYCYIFYWYLSTKQRSHKTGSTLVVSAFVLKIVDVQMSIFFTLRNNAVPTRGNPYQVSLKVSQTNVRRHFLTERIAFIWNSLPPSVVDLKSLSLFKKTIYNANLFTRY